MLLFDSDMIEKGSDEFENISQNPGHMYVNL